MEHAPSTAATEAAQEPRRRKASRSPVRPRVAFWRAFSIWALTVITTVTALVHDQVHPPPAVLASQGSAADGVAGVAFIAGFATVGALLAWKRPANPIGWLMSATGISYAAGGFGGFLANFRPTLSLSAWLGWIWLFGIGLVVFVLLLFPTGALPSRRWRPVAWAAGAAIAGWVLGNAFAPRLFTSDSPRANPIGVSGPAGSLLKLLAGGSGVLIAAAGLASIVSLVFRYRHTATVEREQLKWLLYAGAVIVTAVLAEPVAEKIIGPGPAANNLQNAMSSGAIALVPVAIGVAIFRYHLYDIELVISKTLVYGSLATFITGVYVAIVAGIGSAAGHRAQPNLGLSLLATAIVAVAFQPVRERVQRLANRLVYGKRATPYEVLSEFSARMAGTSAAEDLLPRMARILAQGTGAARADVWLKVGDVLRDDARWPPGALPFPAVGAAAIGATAIGATAIGATVAGPPTLAGADRILAVAHQGQVLGALSVSKRPGESLTPTEDKLLASLAAQAGLVLRNVGLRAELLARLEDIRASRQRLVAAQDEERRRIERNIHDGAQQQLVALAIKLNLTESLIGTDADAERELLAELRREATDAVEDLRDLARGIYPPLLAGEGLAAALRAQARKSPVPTSLTADGVGRYPQDVEAVIYFCVLEALQNISKYASASCARVRLAAAGDELEFEVSDDGAGFDLGAKAYGTGLQGMADRLNALGGSLDIATSPGTGTVVRGRVPEPSR
jgi:signal transduction histidine kinase